MRRSLKAYHFVLAISIFVISPKTFAQQNGRSIVEDSARCQVCRLSLASHLAYLWGPPDARIGPAHNVFVLDSDISRRDLPEPPCGNLVIVSDARINSIAREKGSVRYSRLISLELNQDTAEVVWQNITAFYDSTTGEVKHCIGRTDRMHYRMTVKGWGETAATTTIFALDKP